MTKYITTLILLAFINLNAQDKSSSLENNQFKINVLSPGITYEKRLSKNTALATDLNLSAGFAYNSNSGAKLLLSPCISEQYRYYYNLEKRYSRDRNTKNNSGNFIALSGSYYFRPIGNSEYVSVYDGLTIAPAWGLHRTYGSGINISLIAGAGYNFGTDERKANFVPVVNFTLGWVIGKK
ncbi:hypothetical protein SGQ83_11330 [Flavobacterium sp. Fl-318]|uniref:DUF3575 domain-containing protein n=1 Tax=Flavobacterium cupriresistens TaxID=2893885 RepID=A0ABU4RDK0_9FLAO|nr:MULTISPECIES: hypothetical protein [unclassified Flavobacterium]MDX6189943.1 hypothetical protein [Flavobacterium sp. Fl-318]UFH42768.1 hypothetical protein LNP23_00780 [Flavobacterium sp. F-323]